ncbi:MAG TPA: hypothetical protein VG013_25350 [Gemmataceae bacterium]|jgi:hypothetical protein|nr:hypothetical protein [Gemmataceae bacterium]
MEVAYAFLARGGEFAPDGTLSVFGGDFTTIHGWVFPLHVPSLTVIAKLLFQREDCGRQYEVKVELVGEDNANLAPEIRQELDVPVPADPEKKIRLNLAVMLTGLQFPRAGKYRARLLLSGEEVRSMKFELVQLTAPEPATVQPTKQGD